MRATTRFLLASLLLFAVACPEERGTDDLPSSSAGSDGDDPPADMPSSNAGAGGAGPAGSCSAEGCPLMLNRAGSARHAGQIVADDLSLFCGSGVSDAVTFGVEVECSTVTRPEGSTITINAIVANGTAAVFSGWQGDCAPVAGDPQQAAVVLDGPKSCTAVFDCPEGLEVWNPGRDWLSDPPPRCDTSEMRRSECAMRLGGQASDLPEHFASRDPEATPDVPDSIRAWWDSGQHCLFECPDDSAATAAAIDELQQSLPAAESAWSSFTTTHRLCCLLCP